MAGQPMHNRYDRKRKLPTTKRRPAILARLRYPKQANDLLACPQGALVIMKFIVAVTYAADGIKQMQFLRSITVRFAPDL